MATEMDGTRSLEEQLAHCDGRDCKCAAYGPSECACDADWTPGEVYRLRAELAELKRKIAEAPVGTPIELDGRLATFRFLKPYRSAGQRVALLPLDDGGEG